MKLRPARLLTITATVAGLLAATLVPAAAQATTAYTISGQVFLGTTDTAAGAGEVLVHAESGDGAFTSEAVAVDAQGRYSLSGLPFGNYAIRFDYVGSGDYFDKWWHDYPIIETPTQTVNFAGMGGATTATGIDDLLPSPRVLEGHVYLHTFGVGAGAGEAVVYVRPQTGSGTLGAELPGQAVDAGGAFRFEGLAPGYYTMRVDYVPSREYADSSDTSTFLVLPNLATTTRNVTLPKTNELTGTIYLGSTATPAGAGVTVALVDYLGKPISGVDVATTDAAGRYRLTGIAPGNNYSITLGYTADDRFQHSTTPSTVIRIPQLTTFDAVIPATYAISGTASWATAGVRAPAGTFEAGLWTNGGTGTPLATVPVAADGSYRFVGLRPGVYQVGVFYAGMPWLGVHVPWTFCSVWCGQRLVDADLVMGELVVPERPSISGEVTDPAGDPIDGIAAILYLEDPETAEFSEVARVETDADGAYRLADLDAGRSYRLYFGDPYGEFVGVGYQNVSKFEEPDPIVLTAWEQRVADQTMRPSAHLSGTVTGVTTADLSAGRVSVRVIAYSETYAVWFPTGEEWTVAADGSYRVADLGPGAYRFEFVLDGPAGVARAKSPAITFTEAQSKAFNVRLPKPTFSPGFRDFSGDRKADVLVRTRAGVLVQYAGNGVGGWSKSTAIGSGWGGMNLIIRAGDFSGDGKADVIARDPAGKLWLYRGNGAGGWGAKTLIGSGWGAFTAVFSPGDFDGNGTTDLMGRDPSGGLWLYRGNGAGGFGTKSKVGSGWSNFTAVFGVGDFTGDGDVDVMARDKSGRLLVYRGNGAGGWSGSQQVGAGWAGFTALLGPGDFDGDGAVDVMARDASGALWLYRGNGIGGWGAKSKIGSSGWGAFTIVS